MVEITYGGLWFRWSALDRTDKWLAGGSCIASGMAALPLGLAIGHWAHHFGLHLGSHDKVTSGTLVLSPLSAAASIALITLSAILWWRFSMRQDELFNRMQNWALGMGAAWMLAGLFFWAILASANIVTPPYPLTIVVLVIALVPAFWFVAVRRWAS